MAEPEVVIAKDKVKKKRNLKLLFTCFLLFILCSFLFLLIGGILWFTGYIGRQVCGNFTSGSQLYSTFECSQVEQVVPDEENKDDKFPVKEGSDEKAPQVTQEEVIVSKVFDKASPAVVAIGVDTGTDTQIIGSGFIISPNGLIVTNAHVVPEGAEADFFVMVKGKTEPIPVKKFHIDTLNDIALLEIDGSDYPFLALGDSDKLKPGQTTVAIGNPLGTFEGTVTSGIISGLHREVEVSSAFGQNTTYEDVIQTDAAINPGNSGGPLLNSASEVIGVNFATISGADNLSFALPINRIKIKIDELNQYGKLLVPYLGVEYNNKLVFVSGESVIGAQVIKLDAAGPAKAAGILVGDTIIAFEGETLDQKSLTIFVQEQEIGEKVTLTILRGGETQDIEVTIAEKGS